MAPPATTLVVRGEGGSLIIQDLPAEGSARREVFDAMLTKGVMSVVGLAGKGVAVNGENEVVDAEGAAVTAFEPVTLPDRPVQADVAAAYARIAELEAELVAARGDGAAASSDVPKKNGGLDAWQAYAKTQGATDEDLEGLGRDDIVAMYAPAEG